LVLNETDTIVDNTRMNWAPGYREWTPPDALRGAIACLWTRIVPAEGAPPATLAKIRVPGSF
jgi:hypothetical protein